MLVMMVAAEWTKKMIRVMAMDHDHDNDNGDDDEAKEYDEDDGDDDDGDGDPYCYSKRGHSNRLARRAPCGGATASGTGADEEPAAVDFSSCHAFPMPHQQSMCPIVLRAVCEKRGCLLPAIWRSEQLHLAGQAGEQESPRSRACRFQNTIILPYSLLQGPPTGYP